MSNKWVNSSKRIKCALCSNTMEEHQSHNGIPLVDDRVCEVCNNFDVIPARYNRVNEGTPLEYHRMEFKPKPDDILVDKDNNKITKH